MSLYLCVFCEEEELDGIDVGSYADFGHFRDTVVAQIEDGIPGSKFPTLILRSDCDGEWDEGQCVELQKELRSIAAAFQDRPPADFHSDWQRQVAQSLGLRPSNLYESFIDVDGELLIERLLTLCRLAQVRGKAILFQ